MNLTLFFYRFLFESYFVSSDCAMYIGLMIKALLLRTAVGGGGGVVSGS